MVERNDVVPPQQHPVESAGAGDQAAAVRGGGDQVHERVHRGILNAGEVAAANALGGFRSPIVTLLVARRERHVPGLEDHVEIVILNAVLVLGAVHRTHPDGDPEPLEIAGVGESDALIVRP